MAKHKNKQFVINLTKKRRKINVVPSTGNQEVAHHFYMQETVDLLPLSRAAVVV